MSKAASRKYRDDDERDADRAEARRSGKRLAEWLDESDDDAQDAAPPSEEDRIEAIARRLARPAGGRGDADAARVRRWRSEFDESHAERRVAEDRQTARALSHLADLLERTQEGERRRSADDGLAAFSARLEKIESRLSEKPAQSAPSERTVAVEQALNGVERRLAELSRRIDPRERHEAAARPTESPETRARFDALSKQLEIARQEAAARAEQQLTAMRQVEGLHREIEQMSRAIGDLAPRASVAAIETALADLLHRIDAQRHRGVADDLLAPAERVAGELRAVISELDPSPIVRNLHADVQTIGRRLDALQASTPADAATLRRLAAETSDIRVQLAALAAHPLPLEKIETRLSDLTRRVDSLTRVGEGASRAILAFDMNEIARSIRGIVAEETGASLDAFNRRLEQLAGKLDEAVAHAGGARFDELGRRIDELDRSLTERIEASAARKTVDAGALEHLLTGLARKIDSALDGKAHSEGFEHISRKIERLETRLPSAAPAIDELGERMKRLESRLADTSGAETIARIEAMLVRPADDGRLSELVQRIDGVREALAERAGVAGVGPLEDLVRGLDRKIESALVGGVRAGDLEAIRNQLDDLSLKVDRLEDPSNPYRVPQFDDIADRLERMQSSMLDRAEKDARVIARQEELARLVEQLADRLNAATAGAGPESLKALERHIGELSQRLDRRDPNAAALAAVESRIGALIQQIEDARSVTARAAEEAVRKATQEILRQATPAPGALRESLARELNDIRADQDASSQRTHETLRAVHETLERVVERLGAFEDELTEIRGGAKTAAAAPAPEIVPDMRRARNETPETVDFVMSPTARPGERREPGFGAAPVKERAARPAENAPMDFIAAARRAAQQAAADADAAEKALHTRRVAAAEPQEEEEYVAPSSRSAMAGLGAAVQERKRPLLLGLGALVLMFGAYQIARVGLEHIETAPHEHADLTPAPAAPVAAPPPAASAPKAPAASAPSAPPPRMIAPRAETAPVDRAPTGSIGAGASAMTAPAPDALAIIKARAELGDRNAQYEYAARLFEGRGFARDPRLAAQWFEKAAAQGVAPAQYRLGSMYEKGVGVTRDFERARQFYRAAADAGNARAMHNLAVIYAEGGEEGKPDYPAAAEWFRKGAEFGVRDSQFNLAILYARGLGVGQNLVQSYVWFAAAAAQGDADAAKKRDDVGARLDSKDYAAAKALAASFRAKEPPPAANEVEPPTGGWENAAPGASFPTPLPVPNPAGKVVKPKISSL
jgi:localization factor PodJL